MAKSKDFFMSEGETWLIRLEARDAAGVALDLTNGSAEWAISVEGGALVDTFAGAIINATAGLVDFVVAPGDHVAIEPGEYLYEVRVTLATATVSAQLRGRMTVGESPFVQDAFGGTVRSRDVMTIAVSHETSEMATGDGKVVFHMPWPFVFLEVFIGLSTQSSLGDVTADLSKNGVSMFSTAPSINANEDTSLTGTAAVLATTSAVKGDRMTIDIDAAGTGARGLKMYIIGYEAG